MKGFDSYKMGLTSIAGMDGAPMLPTDADSVHQALGLMDAALAEAKQIHDENSGFWASLKAKVTGAQLDAMASEVVAFDKGATVLHAKAAKVLADPNTTHDDIIALVRSISEMSNISALKDSANTAKLSTLVTTVAKETATQVVAETKKISTSIWDAIPTPWKIGGGVAVGLFILWEVRPLLKRIG